jgi:hypothetical protein
MSSMSLFLWPTPLICLLFFYLRAIFCTFQISVDFYFVPVDGRGGAGEGEGARERGIECILYGCITASGS